MGLAKLYSMCTENVDEYLKLALKLACITSFGAYGCLYM